MSTSKKPTTIPLCHRCQHRVDWLQRRKGYRYECERPFDENGNPQAVCSCYGYVPVKPLVLAKNYGDPRGFPTLALLSARAHAVGEVDGQLCADEVKGGVVLWWKPKKDQKRRRRNKT